MNEISNRNGAIEGQDFSFKERFSFENLSTFHSKNFVDDQEIELINLGTENRQNTWDHMSEDVVLKALHVLLNVEKYPLIVMCGLGKHPTGNTFLNSSFAFQYLGG